MIDYPRHIALYGSLPEGAMKDVRMPYFHQLVQQLEAAEEGIDHEVYSDVLEDLKLQGQGGAHRLLGDMVSRLY